MLRNLHLTTACGGTSPQEEDFRNDIVFYRMILSLSGEYEDGKRSADVNFTVAEKIKFLKKVEKNMASDMMWTYLMHLGDCMWGDYGPGDGGRCIKTEPMLFHEPTWLEISKRLKEEGCCNTILIDIGEGVEYESYPEIKALGTWSKKKLADEIDRLRGMGFQVYPKLNFSTGHDKWMGIYSRMISTPMYYDFCRNVIAEISELFSGPELFHLGMDEENVDIQYKNAMCIVRHKDLYWHDVNYLFSLVQEKGARPWIWSDYAWHNQQRRDEFMQNMSRDVLCSNWYYGNWQHIDNFFVSSMYGYYDLEENGFEQVPTGGNCNGCVEYCRDNMRLTVEKCSKMIAPERLKGFMMASWEMTTEEKKPRHMEAVDVMKEAFDYYKTIE